MEWYKAKGWKGHYGKGNCLDTVVFIRAKDITDALRKYRQVPSVKKESAGRINDKQYRGATPDICRASDEEKMNIKRMEKIIRSWFYFKEELCCLE